ncbi:MAG: hypothetical protein ACFCU4_08400 [Puniceicoccaceae bacterium]
MAKENNPPDFSVEESHLDDHLNDDLYQYFRDNRSTIIATVAIVLAGAALFLTLRFTKEQRLRKMSSSYAVAAHEGTYADFFTKYSGSNLGSLAGLKAAAEALEEGDFEKAASLYEKVESGLTRTPLQGLGQLGRAISILRSGDLALAKSTFRRIADDAKAYDSVRSMALYQLGLTALQAEDDALLSEVQARLEGLAGGSLYLDRLNAFVERPPVAFRQTETDPAPEGPSEPTPAPAD